MHRHTQILAIPRDGGTPLSVYRHVVDTIREGTDIPADHMLVYIAELNKRSGSNGAIGMLAKRMVAEWITNCATTDYMVVPVVDVTVTKVED